MPSNRETFFFFWKDLTYQVKIKSENGIILDHVDGWGQAWTDYCVDGSPWCWWNHIVELFVGEGYHRLPMVRGWLMVTPKVYWVCPTARLALDYLHCSWSFAILCLPSSIGQDIQERKGWICWFAWNDELWWCFGWCCRWRIECWTEEAFDYWCWAEIVTIPRHQTHKPRGRFANWWKNWQAMDKLSCPISPLPFCCRNLIVCYKEEDKLFTLVTWEKTLNLTGFDPCPAEANPAEWTIASCWSCTRITRQTQLLWSLEKFTRVSKWKEISAVETELSKLPSDEDPGKPNTRMQLHFGNNTRSSHGDILGLRCACHSVVCLKLEISCLGFWIMYHCNPFTYPWL